MCLYGNSDQFHTIFKFTSFCLQLTNSGGSGQNVSPVAAHKGIMKNITTTFRNRSPTGQSPVNKTRKPSQSGRFIFILTINFVILGFIRGNVDSEENSTTWCHMRGTRTYEVSRTAVTLSPDAHTKIIQGIPALDCAKLTHYCLFI